jgi:hypothetical protein
MAKWISSSWYGNEVDARISAEKLYAALRFEPTGLHNGGNDSVWQLRAYIACDKLTEEQEYVGPIPAKLCMPKLGEHGEILEQVDNSQQVQDFQSLRSPRQSDRW